MSGHAQLDYGAEFDRLVLVLPVLATVDLDGLKKIHADAEALGPLIATTAYLNGGADRLARQKEILEAAAPLVRLAKRLAAEGKLG